MKARLITLLLALLVSGFVVAGCGDDDEESSDTGAQQSAPAETTTESTETKPSGGGGGAAQKLKLSADPSGKLAFDKKTLSAKAGKVTITMDNPSSLPHAVEIEGNGVEAEGKTVQKGGKSVATADVKPGSYEFYCPVPGHKEGGMEGTLTVK